MEEAKIKLVVLEDQKILLDSFVTSLAKDFDVVGSFDDADIAVDFLKSHEAEVILADTCLKKTNTLDYIGALREQAPKIKIVIM